MDAITQIDFENVSKEGLLLAIIELQKRCAALEQRLDRMAENQRAWNNRTVYVDNQLQPPQSPSFWPF